LLNGGKNYFKNLDPNENDDWLDGSQRRPMKLKLLPVHLNPWSEGGKNFETLLLSHLEIIEQKSN